MFPLNCIWLTALVWGGLLHRIWQTDGTYLICSCSYWLKFSCIPGGLAGVQKIIFTDIRVLLDIDPCWRCYSCIEYREYSTEWGTHLNVELGISSIQISDCLNICLPSGFKAVIGIILIFMMDSDILQEFSNLSCLTSLSWVSNLYQRVNCRLTWLIEKCTISRW